MDYCPWLLHGRRNTGKSYLMQEVLRQERKAAKKKTSADYICELRVLIELQAQVKRMVKRNMIIKDELIATVLCPDRLARLAAASNIPFIHYLEML